MIRSDMPIIMDIERECFEFPWLEDDFIRCLRQRNCIGMVAKRPDNIRGQTGDPIGFMIYELHRTRLHVLNIAVASDYQRQGIGYQLVDKLREKLESSRTSIVLEIRETNLDAQLFFKHAGFRAVSILRNYYDESPEDAYLMQYHKIEQQQALVGSA